MNALNHLWPRPKQHFNSKILDDAHTVYSVDEGELARSAGNAGLFARVWHSLSQGVARALRGSASAEARASATFPPSATIDVTGWPQVEVMRKKAQEVAPEGINPASAEYPTAVGEMIADAVRMGDAAVAEQVHTLQRLKDQIDRLRLVSLVHPIGRVYQTTRTEAEKVLTRTKKVLPDLQKACDDANSLYKIFRKENKLELHAPAPGTHWTMTLALVLGALALETMLNAPLFSDATDYGLTGAMGAAFAPAAFNIAVSLAAGYVFGRQLLRVQPKPRRILGYGGTACFFAGIAVLHFAYATWRHRVAIGGVELAEAAHHLWAWENLQAAAGDATTILLVIVGLLISALSFYKGIYLLGEPYPGYAAVAQQRNQAYDVLDRFVNGILGELTTLHTSADCALGTILAQGRERARQCRRLTQNVVLLQKQHTAAHAQVHAAVNFAMAAFREAYGACRPRAPLPDVLRQPVRIELTHKPVAIDVAAVLDGNETVLTEAQRAVDVMHRRLAEDERLYRATIEAWLKANDGPTSDRPLPDTQPVDDATAMTFAYGPPLSPEDGPAPADRKPTVSVH